MTERSAKKLVEVILVPFAFKKARPGVYIYVEVSETPFAVVKPKFVEVRLLIVVLPRLVEPVIPRFVPVTLFKIVGPETFKFVPVAEVKVRRPVFSLVEVTLVIVVLLRFVTPDTFRLVEVRFPVTAFTIFESVA